MCLRQLKLRSRARVAYILRHFKRLKFTLDIDDAFYSLNRRKQRLELVSRLRNVAGALSGVHFLLKPFLNPSFDNRLIFPLPLLFGHRL